MEYCDGGTVKQLAQSDMKEPVLAYIARETLKAIAYMHSKNHMHRDIKSSNIVLNLDGTVKLADMGLAADSESDEKSTAGTKVIERSPISRS